MTDFRTACEGTALNAVLQERARQLGIKGHSRKSDNAKPLTALLGQCFKQLVVAKRYAEPGEQLSLTALRHWAARAGACCLALIDRIDHELALIAKAKAKAEQDIAA